MKKLVSRMLVAAFVAVAISSLAALPATAASIQDRPNVVFVFMDNFGWGELGAYGGGILRGAPTPRIDSLADEGVKFTQAYACSVCSPSRVSLMTGLNAARHRVTNWTLRKNASNDRKHAKLEFPLWNVNGLSPQSGIERTVHAVALPAVLKEAGYRTIHAGKAHFGAKGTLGENPLNLPMTGNFPHPEDLWIFELPYS